MKKYNTIIIGGGASGMMAAYAASINNNKDILLIEKNEKLGKKIYITGKGRCNVTNSCDTEDLFNNITTNSSFMYSSIYTHSNFDTMNFFETQGIALKVERGNRVFPKSDKSSDIIKGLEKSLKNIEIKLNTNIQSIQKNDNTFTIKSNHDVYYSEKVIIATGGVSYPGTGSTGDGYEFAKNLGHNIIKIKPSLCPVLLKDENLERVIGLTVKNAKIKIIYKNKLINEEFGDFLFTHKGISGPIILTLSDVLTDYDANDVELYCNFKPSIPINELDNRLVSDFNNNSKKQLDNFISNYFPQRLGEYLLLSSNINPKMKLHEINKQTRKELINMMTNYKFNYLGLDDIRNAVITKGGVNTLEINPSTMESKLCEGLYFCGEIMDVSALTGGYNLQIAFSTGYLAGVNASF